MKIVARIATLFGVGMVMCSAAAQSPAFGPLVIDGDPALSLYRLKLVPDEYNAMRAHSAIRLPLPNPSDGDMMWLDLARVEVFADDADLVVADEAGSRSLPRPDVQIFAGDIQDHPGSRAFLAVSPHGTNGYIRVGSTTTIISSGPAGAGPIVIFDLGGPAAVALDLRVPTCLGAIETPVSSMGIERPYAERGGPCKTLRLAIDCDTEFTANLFGGNQPAATVYVATLVGAMTQIYQADTNIGFDLGYLRLWTGTDPWTQSSSGSQLTQFRSYWNSNMGSTPRSLAHLLSGRGLGGGVAYLGVACNTPWAYAVMGNMSGFFPYPLTDHSHQNWDIMVHAHETGHNVGTGHTHDSYSPPIDGCGNAYMDPPGVQDCSQAWSGTIMSYCHICPGGMSNINLHFGDRVSTVIRDWVDSNAGCAITGAAIFTQHPVTPLERCAGTSASFSVSTSGGGMKAYQWRRNAQSIVGATAATYTIASVSYAHAGSYDCVVTTACGAITSNASVLTLLPCGCDPDVNCDFALNGFDVEVMERAVGGDMADFCQPDPDFNHDFALDGFDVEAVEIAAGGGPCP